MTSRPRRSGVGEVGASEVTKVGGEQVLEAQLLGDLAHERDGAPVAVASGEGCLARARTEEEKVRAAHRERGDLVFDRDVTDVRAHTAATTAPLLLARRMRGLEDGPALLDRDPLGTPYDEVIAWSPSEQVAA